MTLQDFFESSFSVNRSKLRLKVGDMSFSTSSTSWRWLTKAAKTAAVSVYPPPASSGSAQTACGQSQNEQEERTCLITKLAGGIEASNVMFSLLMLKRVAIIQHIAQQGKYYSLLHAAAERCPGADTDDTSYVFGKLYHLGIQCPRGEDNTSSIWPRCES